MELNRGLYKRGALNYELGKEGNFIGVKGWDWNCREDRCTLLCLGVWVSGPQALYLFATPKDHSYLLPLLEPMAERCCAWSSNVFA